MKPLLIIASILALASSAAAQPAPAPAPAAPAPAGPPFTPPPWQPDDTHGQVLLRDLLAPFPENVRTDAQVWALRPPGGGGALIASRLLIGVTGDGKEYIRARIEELRRTPEIVAGNDPTAKVRTVSWQERVDDAAKLVDTHLEWAQDDHGTISIVRAVWIRPVDPPDTVEEYRVECVMTTDQVSALRKPCEDAMASLVPRKPEARQAVAVAAAPPPEPAEEPDEAAAGGAPGDTASMRETPATLGPVLATRPAREEPRDMRPFYVGGFLLLVIAVLWWNRKKRAELEADAARDPGDPDAPVEVPDADADDLAAAARDDDKEAP